MKKLFLCLGIAAFATTSFLINSAIAQKNAPTLKLGDPLPANLFVELAKAINPAVVNISTKVRPRMMRQDPFLQMMEQMYGMRPQMQPNEARPHALGTGFIIRDDGLIVTNNHVIAGADEVDVQIDEKSEKLYHAKIIGSDERTDIALIKIEGKNFPSVSLGSSADLQVGEWVAAFGNPFGQGHTMTKGIVSAKGRDLSEINRFPLIQTDAPINPGNSGGPLVNSRGQIVGVNSAIDPRAQGIGFAIPIDEVKALLPQLEKLGRIRKGYLGISLGELDPMAAMQLGLKDVEGAFVAEVFKGSPAHKGGLRPYDVITEFNGKKIKSSVELRDSIADTPIGTTVPVTLIREGKKKSISVTISELTGPVNKLGKATHKPKASGSDAPFELGFVLADPTPAIREQFDLENDVTKPVIVEVAQGSKAERAGLLAGDIVLDINRKEPANAADALAALRKGSNTLRLVRQQSVIFVVLGTE